MIITPINNNILNKNQKTQTSFGHGNESFWKSDYSKKEKAIVATTTALGVFSSLAILAKIKGHSIKPKDFFNFLKNMPIKQP